MSDYRDRFEKELAEASHRLTAGAYAPTAKTGRSGRRAVMFSIAGVLCAGTVAVAATRPWEPVLGDPAFPETQATATGSAPPASQLALLGVLRRDVVAADRGADVAQALKFLGSGTQGVRTAYVRRVSALDGGGAAVIVPARSWQPSADAPNRRIQDAICVVLTQPGIGGAAKSCWSSATIRDGEATASLGSSIYGIVPDGATQVTASFTGSSG
ncbi:MAG: hypothetical protein H0V22_09610, partial [Solirubrobacterales bacterium]|nr:hypothetical protein [Solirubrobacterales bacterium]